MSATPPSTRLILLRARHLFPLGLLALGAPLLSGCGAPNGEPTGDSAQAVQAVKAPAAEPCVGTPTTWLKADPGCINEGLAFCRTVRADYEAIETNCDTPVMVVGSDGFAWFYAACPTGSYPTPTYAVASSEMACELPAPVSPYAQIVTWEKIVTPVPGGCLGGRCPPGLTGPGF
jgi:hypothetical protein